MQDKKAILEPGYTYHIYNRANGSEPLFVSNANYRFFLEKYNYYISPLVNTFCYCLMPNHFHFLVEVKSREELFKAFPKFQTLEKLDPNHLSKQFSNFFSSYTQAFNKLMGRKGSLFMKNFNRKKITDEKYLLKLIHYIHYNPVEAGLAIQPGEWKYSSYTAIVSNKPTLVSRKVVVDLFEDLDNFIYCHKYPPELTGMV